MATISLTVDDTLVPRILAMINGKHPELLTAGMTNPQKVKAVLHWYIRQDVIDWEVMNVAATYDVDAYLAQRGAAMNQQRAATAIDMDAGVT